MSWSYLPEGAFLHAIHHTADGLLYFLAVILLSRPGQDEGLEAGSLAKGRCQSMHGDDGVTEFVLWVGQLRYWFLSRL